MHENRSSSLIVALCLGIGIACGGSPESGVSDTRPEQLEVELGAGVHAAFDTRSCRLLRVWEGGPREDAQGPTIVQLLNSAPSGPAWVQLPSSGGVAPAEARFLSSDVSPSSTLVVRYRLELASGSADVTEEIALLDTQETMDRLGLDLVPQGDMARRLFGIERSFRLIRESATPPFGLRWQREIRGVSLWPGFDTEPEPPALGGATASDAWEPLIMLPTDDSAFILQVIELERPAGS